MKILFYGTPEFSIPTFDVLCEVPGWEVVAAVTQPDRPAGRGAKITESPIKAAARKRGIPVLQPVSIKKDPEFLSQIKTFGPLDVSVVIAFGQILPVEVLNLPKAGSVNVHASLLPRWRGAAPIQRSIMAGDTETGVCLMHMEAGLDTGAVYSREVVPITETTTGSSLHDELSKLGAKMIFRDLGLIVNGGLAPVPQPTEGVTLAQKITQQDALIDWSKSAEEISRTARGLSLRPGAFSFLNGKRVKILMCRAVQSRNNQSAQPGQVSFVDANILEVQCGLGVLSIDSVQMEGKKLMSTSEFLKGNHLTSSSTFLTRSS